MRRSFRVVLWSSLDRVLGQRALKQGAPLEQEGPRWRRRAPLKQGAPAREGGPPLEKEGPAKAGGPC
ncbi:unnamed protein product [Gadus morhua 'NCC']